MKKQLLTALIVLSSATTALSQEVSETDLSRYELLEQGETTKTLADLQAMEDAYKSMVSEGNCKEALPAIIEFYEAANMTSNLILRGSEPYYSARREAQDSLSRDRFLIDDLTAAENASNNLIKQRNRAWVEEAKCLLSLGEKQEAINRLFRALDYIDTSERKLWEEARTLLWAEVGFSPKK